MDDKPSESLVIYIGTHSFSSLATMVLFAPDAVIMKCHRGNSSIFSSKYKSNWNEKLPRISSCLQVQAFHRSKQIDFVEGDAHAYPLKIISSPLPDEMSKVPPRGRHEALVRRTNISKRLSGDCLIVKGQCRGKEKEELEPVCLEICPISPPYSPHASSFLLTMEYFIRLKNEQLEQHVWWARIQEFHLPNWITMFMCCARKIKWHATGDLNANVTLHFTLGRSRSQCELEEIHLVLQGWGSGGPQCFHGGNSLIQCDPHG